MTPEVLSSGAEEPVLVPETIDIPRAPKRLGRFGVPGKRASALIFAALVAIGGAAAGAYWYISVNRVQLTALSFLPEDMEYYLSLRIGGNDSQVQQGKMLMERFPGGDKGTLLLKNFFIELLGRPQDPFQDVLGLAKDEIFLAKISPTSSRDDDDDAFSRQDAWWGGWWDLDKLLNIVALKNETTQKDALSTILTKPGYTSTEFSQNDRPFFHIEMPTLTEQSREVTIDPIPYRITIPYRKEAFIAGIRNFLISGDKKRDIEKVLALFGKENGAEEEPAAGIKQNSLHQAISAHFPQNALVKFYQNLEIFPEMNLFPTPLLFGPLSGGKVSPKQALQYFTASLRDHFGLPAQGKEESNSAKTARAFTIETKDEGALFTFFQEWRGGENLGDAFAVSSSLAHEIPADFRERPVMFFLETKNLAGKLAEFRESLERASQDASSRARREHYAAGLAMLDGSFEEIGRFLGIDAKRDLLSWMDDHMAFVVASGFGGQPPALVLMFRIDDPNDVKEKLMRITVQDTAARYRDEEREWEVDAIGEEISAFFEAQGRAPESLEELYEAALAEEASWWGMSAEEFMNDPYYGEWYVSYVRERYEDPITEEYYHYELLEEGRGFLLSAQLENGQTYSWSFVPEAGLQKGVYEGTLKPLGFSPEPFEHQGKILYALRGVFGDEMYTDAEWSRLYFGVFNNKVVFTHSRSAIERMAEEEASSPFATSLGASSEFQKQFSASPSLLGGLYYLKPYGFWGLAEYVASFLGDYYGEEETLEEQIGEDWSLFLKAYLKTLAHIGGFFTLEGRTLVNPTLFWVEELPAGEKKIAAEAVVRLIEEIPKAEQRAKISRARGDIGSLVAASELYYDIYGEYPNPAGVTPKERWDALIVILQDEGLLGSTYTPPSDDSFGYTRDPHYTPGGECLAEAGSVVYVMGFNAGEAALESDYLERDDDCVYEEFSCTDPVYCVFQAKWDVSDTWDY